MRVSRSTSRYSSAHAHPIFVNVRRLALEEAREPLGGRCGGPLVLKLASQPLPLLSVIPCPLGLLLLGGAQLAPLHFLRDSLLQLGRGERSRHDFRARVREQPCGRTPCA